MMLKKRRIRAGFAAIIMAIVAIVAAQPSYGADGISLDEGIAEIARGLEGGLPRGTRVAVVSFESPSAYLSNYVLEELQGNLSNNGVLVVTERGNLDLRRNELNFQMSGEVDTKSAVTLGRQAGVQVVIAGSLADPGGENCSLRFNAIRVDTAATRVSPSITVQREGRVAFMLASGTAAPPAQVPAKPDPIWAAVYFNAGFAHYEAKRYAEATADFSRALEVNKDDTAVLRYRATSYYYLRDYDRSVTDASRLIGMRPGNTDHYLLRSAVYLAKKDYDKAIADCNQVLRLNPNLVEAYVNRGGAYLKKKDYDKAIADCNEALRINPNEATAYANRGGVYHSKGDNDRAIVDCNEALRLNPNLVEAYVNRGNSYASKGDYDKAIADYNQALRIDPNLVEAYEFRGSVYALKSEYDKGIADYNQALRIDPNSANAYNYRGVIYAMKKDYARARADFEKALQIDPNNASARNSLKKLRGMGY
jgi:tetratricopeptide (TPR) repeat protein